MKDKRDQSPRTGTIGVTEVVVSWAVAGERGRESEICAGAERRR
jgi:hypothetical protein